MNVLMTAFDPFGGEETNPALEALRQVTAPEGIELKKLMVPTVFGDCAELAEEAIREYRPRAVICVGQAGGRSAVTPERIAINLMDATISDNHGFMPQELPIIRDGPAAYFSTLPVKAMAQAIREAGVPSQVSNTAGTFVCNSLLYRVLHYCSLHCPETKACFLHVPFLPEQAKNHPGCPGLPLSQMVLALEAALGAIRE